jgi:hypothetical protein
MFFTVCSGFLPHVLLVGANGGDTMPGGNFDPRLEINHHGCITPKGPLKLDEGETALRLDAWIWQDESACMAVQRVFAERDTWKITTDPHEDHVGPDFKPGAAVAMALMVVSKVVNGKTETETYHWTDAVLLVEHEMPAKASKSAAKSEAALAS